MGLERNEIEKKQYSEQEKGQNQILHTYRHFAHIYERCDIL